MNVRVDNVALCVCVRAMMETLSDVFRHLTYSTFYVGDERPHRNRFRRWGHARKKKSAKTLLLSTVGKGAKESSGACPATRI